MPVVSAKRQITLPVEQCRAAGIKPGDHYQSYVDNDGHIMIIKQKPGAAAGILKGRKTDERFSDEQSRATSLKP